MEANNFEKKIQQKMGELKIPPSDLVWTNIEKRIGKKHKDKKMIFIIFFLILFLLSGGYWLFNSVKNNQQARPVSNLIKNNNKPTNDDSSLNKRVMSSADNVRKHDTAGVEDKKSKASVALLSIISQDKSDNTGIKRKPEKLVGKASPEPKEKMVNPFTNKNVGSKQANDEENEIVLNKPDNLSVNKPAIFETKNKNKNEDHGNNAQAKIKSDSLSGHLKPAKIAGEIISKNDSSAKKHFKNLQKKHWVFGVTFSGGTSLLGNGFLDIDNNNNDYYSVSDPNMNQGSPNSGSGGSNANNASPSDVNNSIAFIGGAFIEKNISAENKISLGISYKYFSLINKVGFRSNTDLAQYSAINTVNAYRNNFHYLELPVSFKFQLNNSNTLPLNWQVGMNISQLISSNALQLQSSPGLYFNDNSFFNKTQFGLNTGISATVFAKQKTPLIIGPYFYYSPSKLAGKGLYQNKHFSFIGIKAEILFKKK